MDNEKLKSLNATQLAYILSCRKKEARDKMIYSFIQEDRSLESMLPNYLGGYSDGFPESQSIAILSQYVGNPILQEMVDDIRFNYMKRSGTRGHILNFHNEKLDKFFNNCSVTGNWDKSINIRVPNGLKSLLSLDVYEEILEGWNEKFKQLGEEKYKTINIKR